MSHAHRKPELLPEKLTIIREYLKLNQPQMARLLQLNPCGRVSEYENGKREPKLETVLAYAYAAKVRMASIIDDKIDLREFRDQLGTFERKQVDPESRANCKLPPTPKPITVITGVH